MRFEGGAGRDPLHPYTESVGRDVLLQDVALRVNNLDNCLIR